MEQETTNKPLVSIIVITYNSSKYVLETLESAYNQSYKNIELIISDDGSSDNTIEICKNWLATHKGRFVKTELITVTQNTGIPANCNRGVKASSGEWIKLIAGDDMLQENAIFNILNFAIKSNSMFIVSDLIYFNDKMILNNYGSKKEINHFFNLKTVKRKYQSYIRNTLFLNIPSILYHKQVYELIGGYDEQFKRIEDQTFIIKALRKEINIDYLPLKTIYYRIHQNSATGAGSQHILNDIYNIYLKYIKQELLKGNLIDKIFLINHEISHYIKRKGYGRSIFFKVFYKVTAPLRLIS